MMRILAALLTLCWTCSAVPLIVPRPALGKPSSRPKLSHLVRQSKFTANQNMLPDNLNGIFVKNKPNFEYPIGFREPKFNRKNMVHKISRKERRISNSKISYKLVPSNRKELNSKFIQHKEVQPGSTVTVSPGSTVGGRFTRWPPSTPQPNKDPASGKISSS